MSEVMKILQASVTMDKILTFPLFSMAPLKMSETILEQGGPKMSILKKGNCCCMEANTFKSSSKQGFIYSKLI